MPLLKCKQIGRLMTSLAAGGSDLQYWWVVTGIEKCYYGIRTGNRNLGPFLSLYKFRTYYLLKLKLNALWPHIRWNWRSLSEIVQTDVCIYSSKCFREWQKLRHFDLAMTNAELSVLQFPAPLGYFKTLSAGKSLCYIAMCMHLG